MDFVNHEQSSQDETHEYDEAVSLLLHLQTISHENDVQVSKLRASIKAIDVLIESIKECYV